MITGLTEVILHVGNPTHTFKSPMIYNPWFEAHGIDAVVVPMAVEAANFAAFLPAVMRARNVRGVLITMPHKVAVTHLVDELTVTAQVAGAANAVRRRPDGTLLGDMFDGAGFVRGMRRKGREARGAAALVVGGGGVGSAIAASLADAGVARLGVFDMNPDTAGRLADRLRRRHPGLGVSTGSNDPAGWDIVVNATPLGMNDGDALPFDPTRLDAAAFVGEVVLREAYTPLLRAAMAQGCAVQVGADMLFEQIPAYLEFFGFGSATPEELRALARLEG